MDAVIDFTVNGTKQPASPGSSRVAAAAMRRYLPHVVAWRCPKTGAPITVTLPEELCVSDLLRRAGHERVWLAATDNPAAPDRCFVLRYAHLSEAEIEEGIRRLGNCLVSYTKLAVRVGAGQPGGVTGI